MLQRLYDFFNHLIHRPAQVFWICALLAGIGVVLDGTAFRLWSLHRDHRTFAQRLEEGSARSRQLDYRIQRAAQPAYIEKAVRDQFDLVKKGDLIFIFSDDSL